MPAIWTEEEIEMVAERAYQLHLQGKDVDALIIFEGLIAIDPRNVYCLEALAALNLKMGAADKALEYANRAIAFSPRAVEAFACRCEASVVLGDLSAAQQDLEALKQLRAAPQVARLTMRIAKAVKFSNILPPGTTLRQLER